MSLILLEDRSRNFRSLPLTRQHRIHMRYRNFKCLHLYYKSIVDTIVQINLLSFQKGGGGSESSAPVSCSFVPLCLPTLTLHCVASVFSLIKRIKNPGSIFKLGQKLTFLFIFWRLFWRGDHWVPMKVIKGPDLWRNQIEGISKFTGCNAVFPARVQIYVFLLPNFLLSIGDGNFKTLLGKCFRLNNTQW